jgi:hypothetical protein
MVHAGFGQRQPVSGYLRKIKTFWEILSDHGLRVGVVNWWGSWPARELRGWNISERFYYKLSSGGQPQEETFPRPLFGQYTSLYKGSKDRINGPDLDRFYMDVFQQQLKKDPVRVAALYLPGFDILNYEHLEAKRMDSFAYADVFVDHLKWLDDQISRLHAGHPEYKFLIIFYRGRALTNQHSAIVIPGLHPLKQSTLTEYDIAPLLLYSCGLPLARGMKQDLIRSVVGSDHLARKPVRYVAPYLAPKDRVESSHVDQFNDLLIEQMKSLGYLQ